MHASRPLPKLPLALVALAAIVCAAQPALADFEERLSLSADRLVLRNLVGRIDVQGHLGQSFEVELRVTGADATRERVGVESQEGREAVVAVRFPLDESTRYVCPHIQGESSFSVQEGRSWLAQLFGGGSVHVSGRGQGLEICADATVRVPRGKSLVVELGAGPLSASGLTGDLDLSTHVGPVEVRGVEGSVSVDTGSGSVIVSDVGGDTHIDTGSGSVKVSGVRGKELHVDTGSGAVEVSEFEGTKLHVDTGSGRVTAEGVGADDLNIDTGSGAVALRLDRMGSGRFRVDTGSGSIDVQLPHGASAVGRADTAGGRVTLDLAEGARIASVDDREAEFTLGDGAARLALDSGGGSIRVHQ